MVAGVCGARMLLARLDGGLHGDAVQAAAPCLAPHRSREVMGAPHVHRLHRDWAQPCPIFAPGLTGLICATSAQALRSFLPRLHWDWARPGHVGTGTRLSATTWAPGLGSPGLQSAPGLDSPLPHRHRAVGHICTGTGWAGCCHICTGTSLQRECRAGPGRRYTTTHTRPPGTRCCADAR